MHHHLVVDRRPPSRLASLYLLLLAVMPLVPVANSPTYQATTGDPSQNQQQLVYDFTKRKRWADLLVQELTEAIMLILSQTGQVWYCGPAVEELLGWKDEEVTDTNVCDIMNGMTPCNCCKSQTDAMHTPSG